MHGTVRQAVLGDGTSGGILHQQRKATLTLAPAVAETEKKRKQVSSLDLVLLRCRCAEGRGVEVLKMHAAVVNYLPRYLP